MLTLVLVTTLSAGAAWHQWRHIEVERAERARIQSSWLLLGALDWARLILREDARAGDADHLGEPWAVQLQEARLTSFLSQDAKNTALLSEQEGENVFLSGSVQDMQARINVYNLMGNTEMAQASYAAMAKLFDHLDLNPAELQRMAQRLQMAADPKADQTADAQTPLVPQRLEHLVWLGLSEASLARLQPFITWLPSDTLININTAPLEVLYASTPDLDLAGAQTILDARSKEPLKSLADLDLLFPSMQNQIRNRLHTVNTRYFEVLGRLRMAQGDQSTVYTEQSLLKRDGLAVKVVWRSTRQSKAFP
jgi:general secretion pathway protein K